MKFSEWLKLKETGTGPYIGGCGKHADFQVQGACSDQKIKKKKRYINNRTKKNKAEHDI